MVAGGYWVYKSFFSSRRVNSLEVISQNAVLVFESHQAANTWNELVANPSWQILKTLPVFQKISDQLITLDSLNGDSGKISKIINGQQVTLSLHSTGIDTFDLLYTINLNPDKAEDIIEEIKTKIPAGARFQVRSYSDQEILEYYNSSNERLWNIALIGHLAVVSPSSFLVEEAIRFYVNSDQQSFYALAESVTYTDESLGRLLISGKGLASMLKGLKNNREGNQIAALESLSGGVSLDLLLEDNQITFKGTTVYNEPVNFTPSIQANLPAIEAAVPNRTTAVTQYNMESIFETQKIVNRSFTARATFSGEIQRRLLDRGFLDSFTGELYLIDLENSGGAENNIALLARSTDPEQSIALLKAFQNTEQKDQVDYYDSHEILFIPEENFPAHLFNGKFMGFQQTFVTAHEDIILFANTQQAMKLVLDDIRQGSTWATSSRAPDAKKDLSPSSGFSQLYLTDKIWDSWVSKANPSWSSFLQKYSGAFQSFQWITFKVNQVQEKKEATLTLHFDGEAEPQIDTSEAISLDASNRVSFNYPLIYGPKAIINYEDNTEDILVQDENNILHLINSAGKEVYSVSLEGKVVSDAYQIDYFKNGKLQLLLATPNKIYGIDRLGNSLENYPVDLGGDRIEQLNLADYDQTKDYRLFVSSAEGNLFLLDKTGKQLEGWNPLKVGEKIIGTPNHYRVPGKGDYMVALSETGKLLILNRRGEKQPGYNVKFGDSFSSGIIAWRDPRSRSTQLVGVTSNGEVIRSNFNGEISYRNQLVKNDRDTDFQLVPDQNQNDFLIISRQYNQVNVLDRNENSLFTTRISDEPLLYQFFDFGSKRQFVAITDLAQNFCYLYDLKGNLATTIPLESSGPIQISYQAAKGQYLIRTRSGSKLTEFELAD